MKRIKRPNHFVPTMTRLEDRLLLAVNWLIGQINYDSSNPKAITVTPGMLLNPKFQLPADTTTTDYTGIKSWTITYSTALDPKKTSYEHPKSHTIFSP